MIKAMIFIFMLCFYQLTFASDIHSSSKQCPFPNQPCNTAGLGSFAIGPGGQIVRWTANYFGSAGDGDDFLLSTVGPNNSQPATTTVISTSLGPGLNSGEVFLPAGNYFIAINTFRMGPGNYSIEYNLEADISVSPVMHNFGNHDEGSAGANRNFTISLGGDNLDVQINSINGTDNAHFVISGPAVGTTLQTPGTTSTSFNVAFVPGNTPGSFSSTITIASSNPNSSVPNKVITVSGTTVALVPDIDCVSSGNFSLDYVATPSGTFNKSFRNEGNAPLDINTITINDNPSGVFSLNGAPSTSDLAPNSSRAVSIRFTPPAAEASYTGSIIITSNSPGEAAKECFFTAVAHHPEPNMVVTAIPDGGTTVDYNDVEIGFTFTKAIKVRNIGDAPLNLTLNLVDPADPDRPQWSDIDDPNNVNIAAGSERIFLQRFTPDSIGSFSIQLEALGTGGGGTYNRTETITLTGNGIAPVPLDNALVLDRSGSMSELVGSRTKIDAMQKAARLYYDLLREDTGDGFGDKIGLIKYNHVATDYLTPLNFKNAANNANILDLLSEAATTDLNKLEPTGETCISCGITDAAGLLVGSPDTRKQVMIVMTDGLQTTGADVNATFLNNIRNANPDLMMYSLGLGNNIDPNMLQGITNAGGGGYHHVSDDLLGTNHFALEEFYFKIYTNASGANLVVDPTEAINIANGVPIEVNRASIVSSDKYAVFMVLDDAALRPYYDLEFIDPNGNVLDPTSNIGGIPIQVLERDGHTVYKIIFPDISQSHTYVGDWILRLNPNGRWRPVKPSQLKDDNYIGANYNVPGEWITPYTGLVPVGFGAAVKSDYLMNVNVSSSTQQPGARVLLTAELTDRGWPSLEGQIDVTATQPNDASTNFKLFDDGTHGDVQANDGIYSNTYNQTAQSGTYKFFFNAIGTNERGELVPRQDTRYLGLFFPDGGDGDNDKPCLPCWINWLIFILILLILAILIRCCRSKISG